MRYVLFTFVILIGLAVLPVLAAEIDTGPEEMDLKARFKIEGEQKPVIFSHAAHQNKVLCNQCHNSHTPGLLKAEIVNKKGPANDYHTNFCWDCHEKIGGGEGKACESCHK